MESQKTRIITPRDEIIARNFSSLISECLGCIDISMPDIQIDDKFSQKKTTKRQLEKFIYDVRNAFFAIEDKDLLKIIDQRMMELDDKCQDICELAFADNEKLLLKIMNKISLGIKNTKEKIVEELSGL
jgi:hypothetical protein